MVESRVQGGYHSLKLNVVQRRPQFEIVVLSKRVKVLFNGSREDNRILRGRDRGLKESKSEKTSTIILLKPVCLYVGVRKLQVVILARSSREMYLTIRIVRQYILSLVRISVQPSNFFIREKHPKRLGNRVASASVQLNEQLPALSPADRAVTVGCQRIAITCTAATCMMCLQYTLKIFDPC